MDFAGLKIGADVRDKAERWAVRQVRIERRRDEISVHRFGTIGYGGNSGFQAINLAVQFGIKRIILVGFDMNAERGIHWHGEHGGRLRNPSHKSLARWRGVIDGQVERLRMMGVDVINAAPDSALKAFPKMEFTEALRVAGFA